MQQKMEEARKEVAAAEQAVSEARKTAVQDTSLRRRGSGGRSSQEPATAARPRPENERCTDEDDGGQQQDQRKSKKLKIPRRRSCRTRRAVDWNGRGSEEQIHPGSQQKVCSLFIKKKRPHDENRQAEVQHRIRRRHCLTKKHCRIGEAKTPAQTTRDGRAPRAVRKASGRRAGVHAPCARRQR